jgi:hypothetical protein
MAQLAVVPEIMRIYVECWAAGEYGYGGFAFADQIA